MSPGELAVVASFRPARCHIEPVLTGPMEQRAGPHRADLVTR
jgi:hypothetical protein